MLVDFDTLKDADPELGRGGSSSQYQPGPPAFDADETALLMPPTEAYEEPPPEFTPYEAKCFTIGDGSIVSHDAHLNKDGEALYRFLLSQSLKPPMLRIRCRGTHPEYRTRGFSSGGHHHHHHHHHDTDNDNDTTLSRSSSRHSFTLGPSHHGQLEAVVDFDFTIDLTHLVRPTPALFSTPDTEPAHRGSVRLVHGISERKKLGWRESRRWKKSRKEREGLGMAPWLTSHDSPAALISHTNSKAVALPPTTESETTGLMSSRSLRDWADEYCASRTHLKEFVFTKHVYNWNFASLTSALRSHIAKSYDTRLQKGTVHIFIETKADKVYVRPDDPVSRALSNKWIRFLLIITLIYPFIWLYMQFGGSAKWDISGAAYPMKQYLPLDGSENLDDDQNGESSSSRSKDGSAKIVQTAQGPMKLVGTREGEWFKEWEDRISEMVSRGYISHVPLKGFDKAAVRRAPTEATLLDGYEGEDRV